MSRALFTVFLFSLSTQIFYVSEASAAAVFWSCRSAASKAKAPKAQRPRSVDLQARKNAIRALFGEFFASMNIAVHSNQGTRLEESWKAWSSIGRSQMNLPGVFETLVSAETAAHLQRYGPQLRRGLNSRDTEGDRFSEDNFFLYWTASLPEPITAFLAKATRGLYSPHNGTEVREIIADQLGTEEGRLLTMNAVAEGLKRTFVQMEIDKSEFVANETLPLFFEQMQKAILDQAGPNVLPTSTEKDFRVFGQAYDDFDPGLPKSSSDRVADRAEGFYSGRALLQTIKDRDLNPVAIVPDQTVGVDSRNPLDHLRSQSNLPSVREAAGDSVVTNRAAARAAPPTPSNPSREPRSSGRRPFGWNMISFVPTSPQAPAIKLNGDEKPLEDLSRSTEDVIAPQGSDMPLTSENSKAAEALKNEIEYSYDSLANIVEVWSPLGSFGSGDAGPRYFNAIALETDRLQELLIALEKESVESHEELANADFLLGIKNELLFARLETDLRTMAGKSKAAQPKEENQQRDFEAESTYWDFMSHQLIKIKQGLELVLPKTESKHP